MWLLFVLSADWFKGYSYIFIINIPIDATAVGGRIFYCFIISDTTWFIFSLTLNCSLSSMNVTITITVTSSISFTNSSRYCAQIMDHGTEIHLVLENKTSLFVGYSCQLWKKRKKCNQYGTISLFFMLVRVASNLIIQNKTLKHHYHFISCFNYWLFHLCRRIKY